MDKALTKAGSGGEKTCESRPPAVGDQGESPKLILGFEEPELYQHPLQAQHMASILEDLATGPEKNTQIILSMHSPYFISSKGFEKGNR